MINNHYEMLLNSNEFFNSPFTVGQKIKALFIVTLFSSIVGIALGILNGFKFPKIWKFNGLVIQPSTKILIPPLIGMILIGLLARNFLGSIMDAWPHQWAQEIKNTSLSFLLIRGGQSIILKDQGLITPLMAFFPQQFEALSIGIISYCLLDMPLLFCLTMAYSISCISPSIIVPQCLNLLDNGYGRRSGIISKIITAGTFDDVVCIAFFGIFQDLAYHQIQMKEKSSVISIILHELFSNLFGILFGVFIAALGNYLNRIDNFKIQIYSKMIYCIITAVSIIQVSHLVQLPSMKYVASFVFGYTSAQIWGDRKPYTQLSWFWFFLQPLLFGCVGASLLLSNMSFSILIFGLIIISIALSLRLSVAYFITKKFSSLSDNECKFMSICWIPKATIQAALGGVVLADGIQANNIQVISYGQTNLIISLLSILLFAPIGSILINTLGPQLLEKSNDIEQDQGQKQIELQQFGKGFQKINDLKEFLLLSNK